jgi:hypothetical protein
MISHQYKCIFVHISKTAGRSISQALSLCDVSETHTHKNLAEIKTYVPDIVFSTYFKWAVVRNPWERLLSFYQWHKEHNLLAPNLTFSEWLPEYLNDFKSRIVQMSWLEVGGCIQVDYIARFERLQNDFGYISNKIGYIGPLPHINKSQHSHYTESYTPDLVDLVRTKCWRDIETFGYHFGTFTPKPINISSQLKHM